MSDKWNDFGALTKLDFVLHGSTDKEATKIYANSKHMIEAMVTVQIVDKANKPINFTNDEIKKQLYFCLYDNGEILSSPWSISDDPSEYVLGGSSSSQTSSDGINYVYKYIACSKNDLGEKSATIAVGIDIPGVGKFDTSSNGTSAGGTSFKRPKSFDIKALVPIDYGTLDNVEIKCGGFKTVQKDLQWGTRFSEEGPYYFHSTGEIRFRTAYIRPNQSTTGQTTFKKHEIIYDPVTNKDVCPDGRNKWAIDTDTEDSFDLMSNKFDQPCAVMGRHSDGGYEVNLWYPGKSHVKINGTFYIWGDTYYHKWNNKNNIVVDDENKGDDGAPTLLLYKMVQPDCGGVNQVHWSDVTREVTVKVTDNYGTEGSIQVTFSKDHFDEPAQK